MLAYFHLQLRCVLYKLNIDFLLIFESNKAPKCSYNYHAKFVTCNNMLQYWYFWGPIHKKGM